MDERRDSGDQKLRAIAAEFRRRFPRARRVSEVMATKEGRDWWRKYGGDFHGDFDLAEGSPHRRVLHEYLAAKEDQRQRKSLVATPEDPWGGSDDWSRDFAEAQPFYVGSSDRWPDDSAAEWNQPDYENHDGFTAEDEEILDGIWDRIGQEMNQQSA
jgi:hypothetical protein